MDNLWTTTGQPRERGLLGQWTNIRWRTAAAEQRRGGGTTVTGTTDLAAVWTAATDELADEIISAQQRAYLRLTRLRAIVEDTALLSVPDAFTRDVIESRLRPAITEALTRRLGRPIQVAVTVRVARGRRRPAGRHRLPQHRGDRTVPPARPRTRRAGCDGPGTGTTQTAGSRPAPDRRDPTGDHGARDRTRRPTGRPAARRRLPDQPRLRT